MRQFDLQVLKITSQLGGYLLDDSEIHHAGANRYSPWPKAHCYKDYPGSAYCPSISLSLGRLQKMGLVDSQYSNHDEFKYKLWSTTEQGEDFVGGLNI